MKYKPAEHILNMSRDMVNVSWRSENVALLSILLWDSLVHLLMLALWIHTVSFQKGLQNFSVLLARRILLPRMPVRMKVFIVHAKMFKKKSLLLRTIRTGPVTAVRGDGSL